MAKTNADMMTGLRKALFAPGLRTLAVVDGASCEALLQAIWEHEPQHVCLYRGELTPDLEAAAPHLVELEASSAFTTWLLKEGWGRHWCIFAFAPAEVAFRDVRKHFRTFLMVSDDAGRRIYFRYYDPRVLRAYLPTCTPEEVGQVLGPLAGLGAESEDGSALLRFSLEEGSLETERVALEPKASRI